jgi:hypothetical protein
MDDRWISAFEAFSRLAKYQRSGAERTICSRAADGLITARARIFIRDEDREEDCTVPSWFWWARGEEGLEQNWQFGDFETWINRTIHCRAYGVMFREVDIDEMMPARGGSLKVEAEECGDYASPDRCLRELRASVGCNRHEAMSQIIRLCRAGMIASRCAEIRWRVEDRFGVNDYKETNAAIPDWFWVYCAMGPDSVLDWNSGNFAGRGEIDGTSCAVSIRGAEFSIAGIVALEAMLASQAPEDDAAAAQRVGTGAPSGSGRPRSEKWTAWIAELVAYVHEEGVPGGSGTDGQDPIIAAVDARLIERGLEGPSRSTVQPVVRAVLQRLRSAGN